VLEKPWRLKRILLHGLEGPIDVLGETYNGAMPAFGQRFKDEQIAAVLSYVRQEWGNDAPPISPASVAATRAAVPARTAPWSAEELNAISEADFVPETAPPESVAPPGGDQKGLEQAPEGEDTAEP
jgi:hypothetical protein